MSDRKSPGLVFSYCLATSTTCDWLETLCRRMGKEEKAKKSGTGKKKHQRGGRGAMASWARGKLRKAGQGVRKKQLREKHREERDSDHDRIKPVGGRVIVPQLPRKEGGAAMMSAPDRVMEFYRRIQPDDHPYLVQMQDKERGKWTAARNAVSCVWGNPEESVSLCCVVGHLTDQPPPAGCGIRIGKKEFINFFDVPVDLGYHYFKPKEVELKNALPNFAKFMRRDPEHFNCVLWRDKQHDTVVWVKPVVNIPRGAPIVLRDDPDFFLDGTAINKKKGEK